VVGRQPLDENRLGAVLHGEQFVLAHGGVQIVHERERDGTQRHAQRCSRRGTSWPGAKSSPLSVSVVRGFVHGSDLGAKSIGAGRAQKIGQREAVLASDARTGAHPEPRRTGR
jgi:hypothetical protein